MVGFFERQALLLHRYRGRFLAGAVAGLAMCACAILLSVKSILDPSLAWLLFGCGFFVTMWAWGLDLIVHWYAPPELDSKGRPVRRLVPRELGPISRRIAAPFLLIWFVVPELALFGTLAKALRW